MSKITLSDEFKQKLDAVLKKFDAEANEATRTHKVIARILNEIEDQSSLEYSYTANPTNEDCRRPDFVLCHKKKEFFILEAKASLTAKQHRVQISAYLKTHNIEYGSLTDGIQWSMYRWDSEAQTLELDVTLYITNPQDILDYILSKV